MALRHSYRFVSLVNKCYLLIGALLISLVANGEIQPTLLINLEFKSAELKKGNVTSADVEILMDEEFKFNIFTLNSELNSEPPYVLAIHALYGDKNNYDISNYWYVRTNNALDYWIACQNFGANTPSNADNKINSHFMLRVGVLKFLRYAISSRHSYISNDLSGLPVTILNWGDIGEREYVERKQRKRKLDALAGVKLDDYLKNGTITLVKESKNNSLLNNQNKGESELIKLPDKINNSIHLDYDGFRFYIEIVAKGNYHEQLGGIEEALIYGSVHAIRGTFANYWMLVLHKEKNYNILLDLDYRKEEK